MKILRAEHLGMCFGVRDAIRFAQQQAQREPLTVLGDLAHNETVLARLRAQGIRMENQLAKVRTSTLMITAHGASERTIGQAIQRGFQVMEATCPLVRLVHRSAAKLVQQGYYPIIVGKRDHVEVRGVTEDLAEYDVVLTESEVAALPERPRFGVVAQTTQPIDHVRHLVSLLQKRFPAAEVRFIDTVCQPTKQRQAAAIELAQRVEVMVVAGGPHSNNTRELTVTCQQHCPRVYQVQEADDLRWDWFAGVQTAGFAAGTSTPDEVIEAVATRLQEFASLSDEQAERKSCRQISSDR